MPLVLESVLNYMWMLLSVCVCVCVLWKQASRFAFEDQRPSPERD